MENGAAVLRHGGDVCVPTGGKALEVWGFCKDGWGMGMGQEAWDLICNKLWTGRDD